MRYNFTYTKSVLLTKIIFFGLLLVTPLSDVIIQMHFMQSNNNTMHENTACPKLPENGSFTPYHKKMLTHKEYNVYKEISK